MGGWPVSSPALSKTELLKLLDMLSERLHSRQAVARLYVIGGACMALAYDRGRSTEDIDVRIDAGHAALLDAAHQIARERGLPQAWLNEQAMSALDVGTDERAPTLYESRHLVVTGASAQYLLAMKLAAGRDKDITDIEYLLDHLKIGQADEALAIFQKVMPGSERRTQARAVLAALARHTTDLEAPTGATERERTWFARLADGAFPRYAAEETPKGLTLTVQSTPEDTHQVLGQGLTLHALALMECGHRGWPNEAIAVIKGFTAAELGRTRGGVQHPYPVSAGDVRASPLDGPAALEDWI